MASLREWLEENTPNVFPVGRNGMHKYNNQDHSMYTAMLSVENILGADRHDIWDVNVEAEYHEEKKDGEEATAPPVEAGLSAGCSARLSSFALARGRGAAGPGRAGPGDPLGDRRAGGAGLLHRDGDRPP